jgi:hypothetical protein
MFVEPFVDLWLAGTIHHTPGGKIFIDEDAAELSTRLAVLCQSRERCHSEL